MMGSSQRCERLDAHMWCLAVILYMCPTRIIVVTLSRQICDAAVEGPTEH